MKTTTQAPVPVLAAVKAAALALAEGRVDDLVTEATQAARIVPANDPALRFRVVSVLQAAFRFTGRPDLFDLALSECRAVADRTDLPELAIPARALAGNILLLAGRFHQALDLCDAAVALAHATGRGDDRVVAMGHQFRGYVLLEWNRLDEAKQALERAWEVTGPADQGVRSGVARVMAEVSLVRGDGTAAARWIDELSAVVSEPMTLRNREWLAAVRTRHGFAARRDLRELDEWCRRHDYRTEALAALPDSAVAARLHEFDHLLTLLESTRRWAALGAVAATIERGSRPLRSWFVTRALTARAVAHDGLGHPAAARDLWAEALETGDEGGLVRVYLDGAPSRLRLLHAALEDGKTRPHAARILAAAGMPDAGAVMVALTERQLEVLRLVAEGLADREVGRAAAMSVATVKTHLRAIYGRLGVRSRTAAVARARATGVL